MYTSFVFLGIEILYLIFHVSLFKILHYMDADLANDCKSMNRKFDWIISKLDLIFVDSRQVVSVMWVSMLLLSFITPFSFLSFWIAFLVLIYSAAIFLIQSIIESDFFFIKWPSR